ncbi:GNL1 [Hepatospora eriocheir]|uniref:GNL1 n=1 Tax=Hepatospora eriocheir TaxID=1081669 RepID=A0A1X0QHE2_9MICR|nr:GNL1 [Hepatospora eriocheir]
MTYEDQTQIFVYLIEIAENEIIHKENVQFYKYFKIFLNEERFYNSFINNNLYKKFPFTKEFLLDCFIGNKRDDLLLIRLGYELSEYKSLIFNINKANKNKLDRWLLYNGWSSINDISRLFDMYNLEIFFDDLITKEYLEKTYHVFYNSIEKSFNKYDLNDLDLNEVDNKFVIEIKNKLKLKKEMKEKVLKFNNGDSSIIEELDIRFVRLNKNVSMEKLSNYLCKLKNVAYLKRWVKTFNFKNMNSLSALRMFLGTFQLASESQIIERVINIFIAEYLLQNNIIEKDVDNVVEFFTNSKDNTVNYYYLIVHSFIFLNTVIHKSNGEMKLSSDEYKENIINNLEDTSIVNDNELDDYVLSIKKNEIKINKKWIDSYDKFILYQSINNYKEIDNINYHLSLYRVIFTTNLDIFYLLDPKEFFNICHILKLDNVYLDYLIDSNVNLYRYLLAYKYYLINFDIKTSEIEYLSIKYFLKQLERIYSKSKGLLKNIFTNSKNIINQSFYTIYNEYESIIFSSYELFITNLIVLMNECNSGHYNNFTKELLNNILYKNYVFYKTNINFDIKNLIRLVSFHLNYRILNYDFNIITYIDNNDLVIELIHKYIKDNRDYSNIIKFIEKRNLLDNNFPLLCLIDTYRYNTDSYSRVIMEDVFDLTINYKEIRFSKELKNVNNLLKFLTSQNISMFNLLIAKKIHNENLNDVCPFRYEIGGNLIFKWFNRIGYLLVKNAELSDPKLYNYTLYILNNLSNSILLFIELIEYVLDKDFRLNDKIVNINIKVLIKILLTKLGKDDVRICCDYYTENIDFSNFILKIEKYLNKESKDFLIELNNKNIRKNNLVESLLEL